MALADRDHEFVQAIAETGGAAVWGPEINYLTVDSEDGQTRTRYTDGGFLVIHEGVAGAYAVPDARALLAGKFRPKD